MKILRHVIFVATLVVCCSALSQEQRDKGWSVTVENDVFSFSNVNSDRNYTMGIYLSLYGDNSYDGFLARLTRSTDSLFDRDDTAPRFIYARNDYGVSAFTPDDLEERDPIAGDRPYSSLVYASNQRTRVYGNYAMRTRTVLGILGLDIAKAGQRFLHNKVGVSDQDPLGWDNQISDGGEPTFMYSREIVKEANPCLFGSGTARTELTYKYGLNVGYYTNTHAGIGLRFGRIYSPYHSFDANPASFQALEAVTPMTKSAQKNESCLPQGDGNDFYGYIGYTARLVGYNVMLQGQFRDSAVTTPSSDVERLVHEVSAGVTYEWGKGYLFTYALQYRTKEFDGPLADDHLYGSFFFKKVIDI